MICREKRATSRVAPTRRSCLCSNLVLEGNFAVTFTSALVAKAHISDCCTAPGSQSFSSATSAWLQRYQSLSRTLRRSHLLWNAPLPGVQCAVSFCSQVSASRLPRSRSAGQLCRVTLASCYIINLLPLSGYIICTLRLNDIEPLPFPRYSNQWERQMNNYLAMATGHQYPPRTSSRFPPGIFVNVQVGVACSKSDRAHTASVNYATRSMRDRLYREQQEEQWRLLDLQQPPQVLMPAIGQYPVRHSRQHHQNRERRLTVRTREQHERGSSAPPALSDRLQPISPVSPLGPIYPRDPLPGITHTHSMPPSGTERPLPPLPSRFRLGEDGLPWSTEPWYQPQSPGFERPTVVGIQHEDRRGEDPQRVRELEALHAAMMTVDSIPHDGWEPWTWDSVGDMPRGPRSLGWAVSRDDSTLSPVSPPGASLLPSPPPPYVVSQWEQSFSGSNSMRPVSSG
jgi:hypothetical protein